MIPQIETLADPAHPITAALSGFAEDPSEARDLSRFVKLGIAVLLVIALVLTWRLTPLAALTDIEMLKTTLAAAEQSAWGPLVFIFIFILARLFAFPVTLLISATVSAFLGSKALFYPTTADNLLVLYGVFCSF